jgi:predicted DNA-binding transcriptional regulator AlpA
MLDEHPLSKAIPSDRLLSLQEVMQITSLRRSSIYAAMRDQKFPLAVKVYGRRCAWLASGISEFIRAAARARDRS